MILLSEYNPKSPNSAGNDYIRKMTEAAQLIDIPIIYFDRNALNYLEEILSYKKDLKKDTMVFWLGYVPDYEIYVQVDDILKNYNLNLINTPLEFAKSEYFDQYYPLLEDLTCKSFVATSLEYAQEKAEILKYPIFLKGTVQSLKKFGWQKCIANNKEELIEIFTELQTKTSFSLGKIILREYTKLKYKEIGGMNIPQAHEYRFFLYNNKIIDYSYYWNSVNTYTLTKQEKEHIQNLAIQTAKKIQTPLISVDIAQKDNEDWLVIETGDGQFSDIRGISPIKFSYSIKNSIST